MKTLLFDLETTPLLGEAWKTYDTNLIRVIRDQQIICFSYKWYGEKKVYFVRPDSKNPWNDKEMIKKLWDLFDEADIIVAHNLNRFDYKRSNAMFLRHGLTPPSPVKRIDTLAVVRASFANSSNKLDSLGEMLEIGKKIQHEGFMALFDGCMHDNSPKWWAKMKKYNDQDVLLLEKLYVKLIPWIANHPQDLKNAEGCPKCGSYNYESRGYKTTQSSKYKRYRCKDCGSWFCDRKQERIIKPKFKNA